MHTIKIKIQIENDNQIAFGPGKAKLLEAIHNFGSIAAAAKSMKMSYKRAWDLVSVMNASFKSPLVITVVGGSNGGNTTLTEMGHEVLELYNAAQSKSFQFVNTELASIGQLLATE